MRFKRHEKIMVFGTGGKDDTGELVFTPLARRRCDRAAEAYFNSNIKREMGSILLSGGYGKNVFDQPPAGREAVKMADYMHNVYDIPFDRMRVEDRSTTTEENFGFSLEDHGDFFEEVMSGERKLALVSCASHLPRTMLIGVGRLACAERQLVRLPAREPLASSLPPVNSGGQLQK